MPDMNIVYRSPSELKPNPRNPRVHSKSQIKEIEHSIKVFGFVSPVLVDRDDNIVAGHGRVEAAKNLRLEKIPVVCIAHLTKTQARAYLITDNKIAEHAAWDLSILKEELQELMTNYDFDIAVTGFQMPEIDKLLVEHAGGSKECTPARIDRSKPAVTRPGDLWQIGEHKVLCGDSTDRASYTALMGSESASVVFTDPPYNVPVAGHVSGLGKVTHQEFAMASGEMSEAQFTDFLKNVFSHLVDFSRDGSLHYICMDWRHILEVLTAGKATYTELKNLCVWAKTNGGMGNLYRSQHELVFLYKKGNAAHINNVELGKHGRNRTNLWTYAGANAFSASRESDLAMHPTVKPVQLVADALLDTSNRGDIVLDAFGGSGTTLVAAEQTGRRGRAIEIDPYYVDTIVLRMEQVTKKKATLGRTDSFQLIKDWQRCLGE